MSKYEEGDFGYWWTVELGNSDIEGQPYYSCIDCSHKKLTSLKGCPEIINGYFDCSNNHLTSLQYCPEKINGPFICANNQLTSLEYCSKIIKGYFWCFNNKIKDKNEFKNFKFCKSVTSDFNDNEIMDLIKENNPEYYF